tara:strand:- start:843 stop:1763 length:921 start_codon:yes stop_codon:yes gene_type:complete
MLLIDSKFVVEICLGSAQFGFDYGITNLKGKVNISLIKEILNIAKKNKIKLIDTAQVYRESEINIGKSLFENSYFKIITKLDLKGIDLSSNDLEIILEKKIQNSLNNLRQKKLEAVLIHDCEILKNKFSYKLINWLNTLKERKLVNRIGISIYEKEELLYFPIETFDIVQLPFSLYDQRMLINGTLDLLKIHNIDIHIRSIFLQGLILQSYLKWPEFFSKSFIDHHKKVSNIAKELNISMLQMTFFFIKNFDYFDATLMGVTNKRELNQIINAWSIPTLSKSEKINYEDFSWSLKKDIDPRIWNEK